MMESTSVSEIRSAITDEIFFALGLHRRGILRRGLGWLFGLPAGIFARFMAEVDRSVAEDGPLAGCQKMLDHLGVAIGAQGKSNIPEDGPAIILANHPGAYDSLAICSLLPRKDLKIIVSKTRFYQQLPNIHPALLYVSKAYGESMLALRHAIDHLKQGGILLQFGSGLIEPDPANHLVGDGVFEKWSHSLEILFRKAPETLVVPTIVSGVLLERFFKHPLTWLRRDAMDQRRLAEFRQVIHQLLFPKSVHARPQVSFGSPFKLADVDSKGAKDSLMPRVIERVKRQLQDHLAWVRAMKLHSGDSFHSQGTV